MTHKRLYKCRNCSMIYWGHELAPIASSFPPSLSGMNCPTPNCGGRVFFGQATPGEAARFDGIYVFPVALGVLHWIFKLDWLPAAGIALMISAVLTLISRRCHQPRSPDEDQRFAANELVQHGEDLQRAKRLQEAKSSYERAATILGTGIDLKLEGAVLGRLANVEKAMGDFVSVKSHYDAALSIAEQIGDTSGMINRLNNIAALSGDDLHNPIDALPYLERAVTLARGLHDRVRLIQMLCHLGKREREAGYLDRARNHANEALGEAENTSQPEILATALYERACTAIAEGRNADAILDLKHALEWLGPSPASSPVEVAKWIPDPAQALDRLDKQSLRKGLVHTLKVVEAATSANATVQILPPGQIVPDEGEPEFLANIVPEALAALRPGMEHVQAGRLALAADCLARALQQNSVRNSPKARVLAGMSLGDALRELGRVEEALEVLRDTLDCVRQAADPHTESGVLLNLGLALHTKGSWAESRRCFDEAEPVNEMRHSPLEDYCTKSSIT